MKTIERMTKAQIVTMVKIQYEIDFSLKYGDFRNYQNFYAKENKCLDYDTLKLLGLLEEKKCKWSLCQLNIVSIKIAPSVLKRLKDYGFIIKLFHDKKSGKSVVKLLKRLGD